jgi:hypothetical protein
MFVDATVGGTKWSVTFRADSFWLWMPWYSHRMDSERMISLSLGFAEFEIRVPIRYGK